MPRRGECSFYDCGRDLLVPGRPLNKSQKNHIAACHTEGPFMFICKHTDRPTTFNRQPSKGMDFVCYCKRTFTLNSSLQRHYNLCLIAREAALTALNTTARVNIPVSSQEEAVALHSFNSSGGTSSGGTLSSGTSSGGTSSSGTSSGGTSSSDTSSGGTIVSRVPTSTALVADPTIGQILEEKMIERHQSFLETFTEHTTAQHTKFMVSMTEHHMTFLQAFTTAQVQQNTDFQNAIAEQHRKAFEQQRTYLNVQRRNQEVLLSEQKLTRAAVKNLLSTKRERSFTLEVDETALKRIQNDPACNVRPIGQ